MKLVLRWRPRSIEASKPYSTFLADVHAGTAFPAIRSVRSVFDTYLCTNPGSLRTDCSHPRRRNCRSCRHGAYHCAACQHVAVEGVACFFSAYSRETGNERNDFAGVASI